MGITPVHTQALFFIALSLLVSYFVKTTYTEEVRTQPSYKSNINEVDIRSSSTEIEPLSANIFPAEITDFLSPEMFSQPDPVRYFLEKIIEKTFQEVQNIQHQLDQFVPYNWKKFPLDYQPYALVLRNLIDCRYNLEGVKKVINDLRSSSELPYPSPPAGLFSPELNELFTPDIFSDNKPPFRLIIKLTNMPKRKAGAIIDEFNDFYLKGKFPERYKKYSVGLKPYLTNWFNVTWLLNSVSKLRDIISRKYVPKS